MLSHASWLSFSSSLYFLKIGSGRDWEGGDERGKGKGVEYKKKRNVMGGKAREEKEKYGEGEEYRRKKKSMGGIGKESIQKGRGRKRKQRKREEMG